MNELAKSASLASGIEAYLLANRRWVKSDELARAFNIRPRVLRALGDRPGICSEFAISSDKGFKHLMHATEAEFQHSYRRVRKHGIAELVGARRRKRYRERLLSKYADAAFERATGQAVMTL